MNVSEVAKSWVEMWSYELNDPKRGAYNWVNDYEYHIICKDPKGGLRFIIEILALNPNRRIIEVLSAGPLEDLLTYHGETLISQIENEAQINKEFAHLLGGVWKNTMPEHIWKRVQDVWSRNNWDGN